MLLTPFLNVEQLLLNPQANGLSELLGDSLEGVKVLHLEDMRGRWGIGNGLQLGSDGVLDTHGKDLHVGVPQLGRRVLEGVRRLPVRDQHHDTRDVLPCAAAGDEDLLPDVGHGFACVGGASAVGEGAHGFDHGVDVVVGVEGKLCVGVTAVLDQAELHLVGTHVKGVDQYLEESSDLGKVF